MPLLIVLFLLAGAVAAAWWYWPAQNTGQTPEPLAKTVPVATSDNTCTPEALGVGAGAGLVFAARVNGAISSAAGVDTLEYSAIQIITPSLRSSLGGAGLTTLPGTSLDGGERVYSPKATRMFTR